MLAVGACLLALAAACSSSHGTADASGTAPSTATSTTDPNLTPNSIPFVVGERIGLPGGWLVTVTKVHERYSFPGLPSVAAGQQYVATDITIENRGPATYTVNAGKLFTMTDSAHGEHFVVPEPGHASGMDGKYAVGTKHSGRLVFAAPTGKNLGLVLYGPTIGTQVSFFTIVPPTLPESPV